MTDYSGESQGFQRLIAAQLAVFIVGTTWAFGGNASWVRTPISLWGSIGILLTVAGLAGRLLTKRAFPSGAYWIWPVVLLNALVLASGFTVSFKNLASSGGVLLVPMRVPSWLPSTAVPDVTLRSLWLFDGIYFSCVNLVLFVERKRLLRIIVAIVVGNAFILAVFGTVQKLIGSKGIFFGAVPSPNEAFFASFVYDNHWGAFMVLMSGAAIALTLRYAYGIKGSGFLHGPALAGLVCVCLMALSVPLSGSRACSLLVIILVLGAVRYGFPLVVGGLHASGLKPQYALAVISILALIVLSWTWSVVGETVASRAEVTRNQILHFRARGDGISRRILYRDTWRMALDKPLFGWGMGTYPNVFPLYNTEQRPNERLPVVYHDAHSDWLQGLAEIGFVGLGLVVSAAVLPLRTLRKTNVTPIPHFLIFGCLLVLLYTLVEFPFGNVAVELSWTFCLAVAVQYMRLSTRSRVAATPPDRCSPSSS